MKPWQYFVVLCWTGSAASSVGAIWADGPAFRHCVLSAIVLACFAVLTLFLVGLFGID